MSAVKRKNPFRSQNRANFPPLDEFFDRSDGISGGSPAEDPDAGNASAISLDQSFTSPTTLLDFSVDMSIGGKAEMALHRYQVQKYGIDGHHVRQQHHDHHQQQGDADGGSSPELGANVSRLSAEGDDWDRVMDDANRSHISFSSTIIAAAARSNNNDHGNNNGDDGATGSGDQTPSPDQSTDDLSTSFFDKSIVKTLMTPEKVRYKLDRGRRGRGDDVTLSRGGQAVLDESCLSEYSACERSTNVSSASAAGGGGFERMFHAALRFNEDFEERSSVADSFSAHDRSSCGNDGIGEDGKSSSGSFVDGGDSGGESPKLHGHGVSRSMLQRASSDSVAVKGLGRLSASPIQPNERKGSFGDRSSFLREDRSPPSLKYAIKSEVSSLASPAFSTPRAIRNGGGALQSGQSAPAMANPNGTDLRLLGFSPIDTPRASPKEGGVLPSGSYAKTKPDTTDLQLSGLSTIDTPMASPNNGSRTLQSGHQGKGRSDSANDLQLMGLSPIDSRVEGKNKLKGPISAQFDEGARPASVVPYTKTPPVPFDKNRSYNVRRDNAGAPSPFLADESTKKNLFREGNCCPSMLGLEIANESIELIEQKPQFAQCCTTQTTVKSEVSYFEDVRSASMSEEVSPFSYGRTFGSNAAFRINSNVTNIRGKSDDCDRDESCALAHDGPDFHSRNRRGVRLSRLSKLKELGLSHALSRRSSLEDYEDSSF